VAIEREERARERGARYFCAALTKASTTS
jgi:hypothetical protein